MCCCFRGRFLNFTTNLYVNFISIHIPTLHTLFSFIPTDHEIAHQWSGKPHSWDSIYQHQRKPQRLLVKLLTNKFNTKVSFKTLDGRSIKLLHPFPSPASGLLTCSFHLHFHKIILRLFTGIINSELSHEKGSFII